MPTSATKSDNRRNRFRWRQQKPGLTKGNKTRVFASHNYEDKQAIEPTKENMDWWDLQLSLPTQKRQFHMKLYLALEQSQVDGFEDVISWMPHGRAFKIVDRTRFEKEIFFSLTWTWRSMGHLCASVISTAFVASPTPVEGNRAGHVTTSGFREEDLRYFIVWSE